MCDIQFTFANMTNIPHLLELNKKMVPQWFHYNTYATRGNSSDYSTLDARERYLHGGPWLSTKTLEVHLNSFTTYGQILLMWKGRKLIGELEFHEMIRPQNNLNLNNGNNYRCYHIDWMMILPEFQDQGYGTKLLDYFESYLQSIFKGQIDIITEPEIGIVGFYEKNHFENRLPTVKMYRANGISSKTNKRWIFMKPSCYEYIYANYDVTTEYSLFQIESEMGYANIFNVKNPNAWLDINPTIRVIKQKSSVFNNKYKLIITSKIELKIDDIINILSTILQNISREEEVNIALPLFINDDKWILKQSIPKLIKSL